jgi:protein disulfide-isomerase
MNLRQTAMKTIALSILALLCTAGLSIAKETMAEPKKGWSDNYAASLAQAKEEKKMVLLDFTGSDWCGWCVKLDEEVFSKGPFKSFAKKNLVLVELDYPHDKTQTDEVKKQNSELKSKFAISGYPTLILVDAEGKEAGRWVGFNKDLLDELKDKVAPKSKAK